MLYNIRLFFSYARRYGYLNTLYFVLFKIRPKSFVLLYQKFALSSTVLDYVSWQDFGGADKPVVTSYDKPIFIWFVPNWQNVWGGGHFTLFRFAHHFSKLGVHNIIYVYNNKRHRNAKFLQAELNNTFDKCMLEVVVDPRKLPKAQVALATTWQSAYDVKAFPFAEHKFYFMQDYESLFYAFGTASMQANATYSFGFRGITGGNWLKSRYESHAGAGTAQNYRFAADKSLFFPSTPDGKVRHHVKRLFFYGRPSTERRCFELGMAALKKIADAYPDVEIVIAGLDLTMEPPFKATCLGNMTLAGTGELYRTCDVGIAFSGTNLSYLPVELMQSGVPVISNKGDHVEWHCKHGENAYLVDPVPTAVFDAFAVLYNSEELRQKLVDGGLKTMEPITWEKEMNKIFEYMKECIISK